MYQARHYTFCRPAPLKEIGGELERVNDIIGRGSHCWLRKERKPMHKPTIEDRVDWISKSAARMDRMVKSEFQNNDKLPRKIIRKEAAILLERTLDLFLALHGYKDEEADD